MHCLGKRLDSAGTSRHAAARSGSRQSAGSGTDQPAMGRAFDASAICSTTWSRRLRRTASPSRFWTWARPRGIWEPVSGKWYPAAKVTSLDYVESHSGKPSPDQRVAGDAFRLPFRTGSFDYVFCSLFLHHFQDMDVVRLLRGFAEVARKAVLVIDLERNPVPYYFIAWSHCRC